MYIVIVTCMNPAIIALYGLLVISVSSMTLRRDRDTVSEKFDTMRVASKLYSRKILGEEDFHRITEMMKSGMDKVETNGHLIDIFLRPSMKRHTDAFLDIVHSKE